MTIAQTMICEFENESATTRRFLERLPADKLDWKPHDKSLTAGQLAMHIATIPGLIGGMGAEDECPPPDFAGAFPQPESFDEILAAHDKNVIDAKNILEGIDDSRMQGEWKMVVEGNDLMAMPRVAFFRSVLLNHLYHHRGQFGVYLRLLNVEVPWAYGPSGDEVPPQFQAMLDAMGAGA